MQGSNQYENLLESQSAGQSANPGCHNVRETLISEDIKLISKKYPDQLPGKKVYLMAELVWQSPQHVIIVGTKGPFSFCKW